MLGGFRGVLSADKYVDVSGLVQQVPSARLCSGCERAQHSPARDENRFFLEDRRKPLKQAVLLLVETETPRSEVVSKFRQVRNSRPLTGFG